MVQRGWKALISHNRSRCGHSIYKSEKKYYLSLAYKKDDGNEATEVYDIGESDYVALYMLDAVLNLGLFETTRSAPPPKAHWLKMKGINNEYNINCIASNDEGYDIEGETRWSTQFIAFYHCQYKN